MAQAQSNFQQRVQSAAIDVAVQQATPEATNGPSCKCDAAHMQWLIFALGVGASVLVIVQAVLNLMTFNGGITGVILNVYLIMLSALLVTAEFRRFKFLRPIIFWWIKYVYFLTTYGGRSAMYFFIGSLNLDLSKPMLLISAGLMLGVSVMCFLLSAFFKLPNFPDAQVAAAQQQQARRQAYIDTQQQAAAAGQAPTPFDQPPPPGAPQAPTMPAMEQPPVYPQQTGYVPPQM